MASRSAKDPKQDAPGRQHAPQKGGGGHPAETGPLFPRLHVNETEKAGPRAPPRNKMALYEQFTIPSHRFVPPSTPLVGSGQPSVASSFSQKYFPNECRYSYPAYFMPPALGYATVNVGIHSSRQPSLGISSGSAVVDNEGDSQRVPGTQSADKNSHAACPAVKTPATPNSNTSHKNSSGKKVKDDLDFRVPTFCAQKVSTRVSDKSIRQSEKLHQSCMSSSSNLARSSTAVHSSAFADFQHEASISGRARIECLEPEVESHGDITGVADQGLEKAPHDAIGEVQVMQVDSKDGGKIMGVNNENHSSSSSGHLSQQEDSDDYGYLPEQSVPSQCQRSQSKTESIADGRMGRQCFAVRDFAADIRDQVGPSKAVLNSKKDSPSLSITEDVGADIAQNPADVVMEDGSRVNTVASNMLKPQDSLRSNCESTGESQNISCGSVEVSEPSLLGEVNGTDDSDSSMLDSVSAPKVLPKDVMKAVGQQQFWRARRAILRQQRIFSDQVFELHKLIKVQQLLAATPNTLIEDEPLYSPLAMMPEIDDTSPLIPDKAEGRETDREAHNFGVCSGDDTRGHPLGPGTHPGVPFYPNWFGNGGTQALHYDPHSQMYFGPYPSLPAILPGGMSAWGYPHPNLGMGQWLGPMAFPYHPFLGGFPPAPFGGAYGSATGMAAPLGAPSMVPFSLPVCNQRPGLPQDMCSGYGPMASGQPWQSTMCMPIGPDSSGSWYAMQGQFMDPAGRLVTGNQEEVPSGSIASNTSQPQRSSQTKNTLATPAAGIAFNSQGTNHVTGRSGQPGIGRFNRPAAEAEQSKLSTGVGSGGNAVALPFPTPVQEQAGRDYHAEQAWAKDWNLVGTYSHNSNQCADEVSLVERGDTDARLERQLKCQKEGLRAVGNTRRLDDTDAEADYPLNRSRNALSLFPLAPISSHKENHTGEIEEWQGRVIKAVPRAAVAAPESAKGILLSIQQERQQ